MIQESLADVLPIWMLLSAAFGFLVGEAIGDSRRHRKCLEEANEDLRDELGKTRSSEEPLRRMLKEQRGVINDTHRRVVAVVKELQNRPSSEQVR